MMPTDPKVVPCLFCTKNPRRNPDSDFCQQCWDEWKRTGVKPKAVIHGDGTPIQPVPVVLAPTQQAANKAPVAANRAALREEEEPLTAEDLFKLQHPMLTINGKQYVRCTECKERPLKIARLCEVCYEKRMKAADMKSQYNVVKRGIGKPKFECPYCHKTGRRSRLQHGSHHLTANHVKFDPVLPLSGTSCRCRPSTVQGP